MKRIFRFFLTLLLLGALILPVLAAGSDLTMTDVSATADEPVYITVTLNKETTGDTMGIEYSYDTRHLEVVPELCSWSKKASVKDFGLKGRGVWAAKSADKLSGSICTLAFRVKNGADFSETTVQCTLIVKNGTKQTGSYQAEATVTLTCDHTYSPWDNTQKGLHSRSCEKCGIGQTEPHSWDSGVLQADPKDSSKQIRLFTCTVCAATRSEAITTEESEPQVPTPSTPTNPQPTEPTRPQPTEPTRPQPTEPTRPQPTEPVAPTQPANPQPTEPTNPQTPTQPQHGHEDHAHTQPTVRPQENTPVDQHSPHDGHDHGSEIIYDKEGNIVAIYDPESNSIQEVHGENDGHVHTDEPILVETKPNTTTAIAVAILAAAGIGGAIFFVKKKR